jgi:predicted dehydrogenase
MTFPASASCAAINQGGDLMGPGKKQLRVGMIGYGMMGLVHSRAYRALPLHADTEIVPVLQAICGRDENRVRHAAEKMGWASYETDWRRLIERDDIDLIDIGTPNNVHAEIAIAAAKAGKHILCEKPLAMNLEEAHQVLKEAQKAGIIHMVSFNYRYTPALQYAKQLIVSGRLGNIRHVRAVFLQDLAIDPMAPLEWRFDKQLSGSGALGDLMSHSFDLARFLVGEVDRVTGYARTFIKERPLLQQPKGVDAPVMGEVEVDDCAGVLAEFANGATGVFETTRLAGGNGLDGNRIEINGDKGSIRWNMMRLNELELFLAEEEQSQWGFRTITSTREKNHPYAENYWVSVGYQDLFVNLFIDLMNGIARGESPSPNFEDGLRNQKILDAVEKSVASSQWVSVN